MIIIGNILNFEIKRIMTYFLRNKLNFYHNQKLFISYNLVPH